MRNSNVSVIIPVYNGEKYIAETVNSVLTQTFHPKEVIIVNDGSTDETLKVLEPFGEKIKIITKANGGVSSARNVGIQEATGEWVAFIDGDDIWHPNKLELQVAAVKNNSELVVVYSGFLSWLPDENHNYIVPEDFSTLPVNVSTSEGWIYHRLLLTNWVLTSTAMLKREAISKLGAFDEKLPVAEDWELFLRLSRLGLFCKIDVPLVLYRQSSGSLSSSVKEEDYASLVIEEMISKYGYQSPNGECTSMQDFNERAFKRNFNYGLGAIQQKWYKKSAKAFGKALSIKPRHFKARLFYVYSLLAASLGA